MLTQSVGDNDVGFRYDDLVVNNDVAVAHNNDVVVVYNNDIVVGDDGEG